MYFTSHRAPQVISTIDSIVAKMSIGTISALYWYTPRYWLRSELSRFKAMQGNANTSIQGTRRRRYPAGARSIVRYWRRVRSGRWWPITARGCCKQQELSCDGLRHREE